MRARGGAESIIASSSELSQFISHSSVTLPSSHTSYCPLVSEEGKSNTMRRFPRGLYVKDLFHTLTNAPWLYTVSVVCGIQFLLWLVFAFLYWTCDQDDCVTSSNAASTIGFGVQSPRTLYANIVLIAQTMLATVTSAMLFGILYTKWSRPTSRHHTLKFSANAVIGPRDTKTCLQIRLANLRKHFFSSTKLELIYVRREETIEGELYFKMSKLKLGNDPEPLVVLPWTLFHVIDEESPLYDVSVHEMISKEAEIIVVFSGTDSSTGGSTEAVRSYAPMDLLPAHKFKDIVTRNQNGFIEVDFHSFDEVIPL